MLAAWQFLCDGLEEDMAVRWAQAQAAGASGAANKEVEALTRASGKMLLLHKLLHKLRSEGRQVGLPDHEGHVTGRLCQHALPVRTL